MFLIVHSVVVPRRIKLSPVNKDHRVGLKLRVFLGMETPFLEEASLQSCKPLDQPL